MITVHMGGKKAGYNGIGAWRWLAMGVSLWLAACQTSPVVAPAEQPVNAVPAHVAGPAEVPPVDFGQCLAGLDQQAAASGISVATREQVLRALKPLPVVLDLDRKQPEFTETFRGYLGKRISDARVRKAREYREQYRGLLADIEAREGVPASVLLAFWALESDFGRAQGSLSTLDALVTLACDGRRSRFFTSELMEALHLVDDGVVVPAQFKGSWAGAVGNVQFMPSTWRRYARDGDGDGRIDLWRSTPDALASAAHYLAGIGWVRGSYWGQEVRLPAGFDYALTGRQTRKSVAEWTTLGVRPAAGALRTISGPASIVVPSGHTGPAFLVGRNFDVILKWNTSEFYALSVGHLSDRIAGAGPLVQAPPDAPRVSAAQVKAMQCALVAAGFDAGVADGVMGSGTRAALRAWQAQAGMIADGYPSADVLAALGAGSAGGACEARR